MNFTAIAKYFCILFFTATALFVPASHCFAQSYRRAAAVEATTEPHVDGDFDAFDFYRELADREPDADDFRAWRGRRSERDWDYDGYGPRRGTYSPRKYNYGPYNYLPEDPLSTSPYMLEDTHDGWDVLDDELEDRRYWYEIHDREPDRDDYLAWQRYGLDRSRRAPPNWRDDPDDNIRYEPYMDEMTPLADEREDFEHIPRRALSERSVGQRYNAAPRRQSDLRPPQGGERRGSYLLQGRVTDLEGVLLRDARPVAVVLAVENEDGRRGLVYFGPDDGGSLRDAAWIRPQEEVLTATGEWIEIHGRRVLWAGRLKIGDESSRQLSGEKHIGRITGMWSMHSHEGDVDAVLLRFEREDGRDVPLLVGARRPLTRPTGALVSPGDTVYVFGQMRRRGQTSVLFAQETAIPGDRHRRLTLGL